MPAASQREKESSGRWRERQAERAHLYRFEWEVHAALQLRFYHFWLPNWFCFVFGRTRSGRGGRRLILWLWSLWRVSKCAKWKLRPTRCSCAKSVCECLRECVAVLTPLSCVGPVPMNFCTLRIVASLTLTVGCLLSMGCGELGYVGLCWAVVWWGVLGVVCVMYIEGMYRNNARATSCSLRKNFFFVPHKFALFLCCATVVVVAAVCLHFVKFVTFAWGAVAVAAAADCARVCAACNTLWLPRYQ